METNSVVYQDMNSLIEMLSVCETQQFRPGLYREMTLRVAADIQDMHRHMYVERTEACNTKQFEIYKRIEAMRDFIKMMPLVHKAQHAEYEKLLGILHQYTHTEVGSLFQRDLYKIIEQNKK